jgi:hypothetical protein
MNDDGAPASVCDAHAVQSWCFHAFHPLFNGSQGVHEGGDRCFNVALLEGNGTHPTGPRFTCVTVAAATKSVLHQRCTGEKRGPWGAEQRRVLTPCDSHNEARGRLIQHAQIRLRELSAVDVAAQHTRWQLEMTLVPTEGVDHRMSTVLVSNAGRQPHPYSWRRDGRAMDADAFPVVGPHRPVGSGRPLFARGPTPSSLARLGRRHRDR